MLFQSSLYNKNGFSSDTMRVLSRIRGSLGSNRQVQYLHHCTAPFIITITYITHLDIHSRTCTNDHHVYGCIIPAQVTTC